MLARNSRKKETVCIRGKVYRCEQATNRNTDTTGKGDNPCRVQIYAMPTTSSRMKKMVCRHLTVHTLTLQEKGTIHCCVQVYANDE